MRFVILNTDYPDFLQQLYQLHPGLERSSYDDQMQVRMASLYGVADFYSSNLRQLGHEVWEIHPNNSNLQSAWAREHKLPGVRRTTPSAATQRVMRIIGKRLPRRLTDFVTRRVIGGPSNAIDYEVLTAQLESIHPDVILNHAVIEIDGNYLKSVRHLTKVLIGQHAATPLPVSDDYRCYDLMLSSFPAMLDDLTERGVPARAFRLGFEPRVLDRLPPALPRYDVTFVGSFQPIHGSRTAWMEELCEHMPQIGVWAPSLASLSPTSPIRRCYKGQAWGLAMYRVLQSSRITLNHHGNVPRYANNMRLYEATGVGTLLLTDHRENLGEMFEPGREVVCFQSAVECRELIAHYLLNESARAKIAQSGQARTLTTHTYYQRMQELIDIVQHI